jgi:hypothetical protein
LFQRMNEIYAQRERSLMRNRRKRRVKISEIGELGDL